jgi:hypothetical protein
VRLLQRAEALAAGDGAARDEIQQEPWLEACKLAAVRDT